MAPAELAQALDQMQLRGQNRVDNTQAPLPTSRETPIFTGARIAAVPRYTRYSDYVNSHIMASPSHNPWQAIIRPDVNRWSTLYENYEGSVALSQGTRPPTNMHGPSLGYFDDGYTAQPSLVGPPRPDPPGNPTG